MKKTAVHFGVDRVKIQSVCPCDKHCCTSGSAFEPMARLAWRDFNTHGANFAVCLTWLTDLSTCVDCKV